MSDRWAALRAALAQDEAAAADWLAWDAHPSDVADLLSERDAAVSRADALADALAETTEALSALHNATAHPECIGAPRCEECGRMRVLRRARAVLSGEQEKPR